MNSLFSRVVLSTSEPDGRVLMRALKHAHAHGTPGGVTMRCQICQDDYPAKYDAWTRHRRAAHAGIPMTFLVGGS